MKIAKLHDGQELFFPPEMPDQEMDARVQQHLTRSKAPGAELEQLLPEVVMAMGNHLQRSKQTQGEAQSAQVAEMQAMRMQEMEMRRQESEAHLQAIAQIAMGVQQALGAMHESLLGLQQAVGAIAQNVGQTEDIVKAVNNLSATLSQTGGMFAKIMRAPKEITRDASGAPVGMKVKQ